MVYAECMNLTTKRPHYGEMYSNRGNHLHCKRNST